MTPDGCYFVVRGRLWRMANPGLDEAEGTDLVSRLMATRRAVREAKKARKAAAGQKEMLMPIAGKKPAKESVAKKPAAKPQRKSA